MSRERFLNPFKPFERRRTARLGRRALREYSNSGLEVETQLKAPASEGGRYKCQRGLIVAGAVEYLDGVGEKLR
jgi:hypothetical protein